jgi:hypothetical protein
VGAEHSVGRDQPPVDVAAAATPDPPHRLNGCLLPLRELCRISDWAQVTNQRARGLRIRGWSPARSGSFSKRRRHRSLPDELLLAGIGGRARRTSEVQLGLAAPSVSSPPTGATTDPIVDSRDLNRLGASTSERYRPGLIPTNPRDGAVS